MSDKLGLDFMVVFEQTGVGHVLVGVKGDEFLISNYAKGYSETNNQNFLGQLKVIKNIIYGEGEIKLDKQASYPLKKNELYKSLIIKTRVKQDEWLRNLVNNYQINNNSRYAILNYNCSGFAQDILQKSGIKTKYFNDNIKFIDPKDLYSNIKIFNKETKEY